MGLARLMLRELSAAWNQWLDSVDLAQKSRKAMQLWTSGALVGSWSRWLSFVEEKHQFTQALRKATAFWFGRALVASWNRWLEHAQTAREHRAKAARILGRWQNRLALGALESWRATAQEQVLMRSKVEGALKRLMLRELSAAGNQWAANVELAKKSQLALSRWTNSALMGALARWVDAVAYQQDMRAKLEGAMARLMLRELSAAWNQWAANVEL